MSRMSRFSLFLLLCLTVAILTSCSREEAVNAPMSADINLPHLGTNPQLIASEIIQASGWELEQGQDLPADKSGPPHLRDYEREMLVGDIAHYWWDIPIGPGEYDMIRLHRVVKEKRPHRPAHTKKSLFCVHGTPGHFEAMYLSGTVIPSAPDDHSIGVYLAENNVDVWGIDQAYTLLPVEITDFSFMDGWGMQFDAENILTGMSVARFVRRFTGNGNGKMNLMGFSTGFMTGFAALNIETQLPPGRRQIGGFIPIDFFYKTQDHAYLVSECIYAYEMEEALQAGEYHQESGLFFQMMGALADEDPDGISPFYGPDEISNLQFAIMAGALTSVMFGFPGDTHFFAGIFDDEGVPIDLNYTPVQEYLEWLQTFNNYGSNFMEYDIAATHCDEEDVPFDDYLHEINVPVFFVGAGGGWGHMMDYTASLLGSEDIELLNIQLQSEVLLDIGHVDIYTAVNAEEVFWQPVLDWIVDHTQGGRP